MKTHEDTVALMARLREHGGIVPATVYALMQVRGKDAQDLIHRLSTNDLRKCRPGISAATVFTTEKGRIIDRVEVAPCAGGLWMVCHGGARDTIRDWIAKYTITEDVEVIDVTSDHEMISILTGDANSIATLGGHARGSDSSSAWRSLFGPLTMIRSAVRSGETTHVISGLQTAGVHVLTESEFRALRVACGVPSFPEELNDAHNPLESGLRSDISFTKGCYIGQEVIARLDAYDKIQKVLVVLAVRADGAVIPKAAPIGSVEGIVGTVTTAGGLLGDHREVLVMAHVARRVIDEAAPLTIHTDAGPRTARMLGASGSSGVSGSVGA